MSTIGYGTPDTQFNNCTSALFAIMTQTLLALILNGVLVGTLYTKIARSKQRSVRIMFSDKACIRQIRDRYYFMFQTFDRSSSISHNQLIEAHVRCYAIKHETTGDKGEPIYFQQCLMRLSHPNDELGAPLMMALPTLVVHRIDMWSPLAPPIEIDPANEGGAPHARTTMNAFSYPCPVLREVDCETGMRQFCVCEVCGEAFETPEQLELHRASSAVDNRFSGHGPLTVCDETGETQSVESLATYCSYNEFNAPRPKVKPSTQRRHSRLNHLQFLPRSVRRKDALALSSGNSRRSVASEPIGDSEQWLLGKDDDEEVDSPHTLRVVPTTAAETSEDNDTDDNLELDNRSGPSEADDNAHDYAAEPWRNSDRITAHLRRTGMEILVYVEAIENYTSSTMQARHSYHFAAGDIEFHHEFVPCVHRRSDGKPEIDLDAFHRLRRAKKNAKAMLSTPSVV